MPRLLLKFGKSRSLAVVVLELYENYLDSTSEGIFIKGGEGEGLLLCIILGDVEYLLCHQEV